MRQCILSKVRYIVQNYTNYPIRVVIEFSTKYALLLYLQELWGDADVNLLIQDSVADTFHRASSSVPWYLSLPTVYYGCF